MVVATKHDRRFWRVSVPFETLGSIKLEIGCGQQKTMENYVGLDIQDFGQEIVWDLDNGIPLPDNSCEAIFARHVLEHLDNPVFCLNECWRVLRPHGVLEVLVPYFREPEACALFHTHFFSEDTFKTLTIGGVEERYGVRPWKEIEISVGTDKWPSGSGQKTVYAKLEVVK